MPGRLLSYGSVAHLLDVSTRTVRRLVEKGLLEAPARYKGIGWRFQEEAIWRYLICCREAPPDSWQP
jgi:excisionase family DNA binding protein